MNTEREERSESIRMNVNKRYDDLFWTDSHHKRHPYVCLICDEILKPSELQTLSCQKLRDYSHLLKPQDWNSVSESLHACYMYKGETENGETDLSWLRELLLSPRAAYIKRSDRRRKEGFSLCQICKSSLLAYSMPPFAIANNFSFGNPPECLTELTEVELAYLTPVKTHGYIFGYTGGQHKKLKGSLSYYKASIESIVRSTMHFDVLGLTDNIVVLLYGQLTPEQKERAKKKNQLRTVKVMEAVSWLLHYNSEWRMRNIDLDAVRRNLRDPILIDNSRTVTPEEDNHNSNVEQTESFEVYFPDGTLTNLTGGQESMEEYKRIVLEATRSGYDIAFRNELITNAVSDYKDNNLVNACLLQFPYGRGGMNETRLKSDDSFTSTVTIDQYVRHLSRLSQPHFQKDLFTQVLYNLSMKQNMVRTAGWKVRSDADAQLFAQDLRPEDVEAAAFLRSNGRSASTNSQRAGTRYLKTVDAITESVPHTDEAAKRARRHGEAMQHWFGLPNIFLTASIDDDNNYLIQVYSGIEVDDDTPVATLTDEQLRDRAKKRTAVRLKYPGICALNFELMLDIIIEEVIGWDVRAHQPREDYEGLFGTPLAFTASIEEQGRTTLHAHMQVWVKHFSELREALHSTDTLEATLAKDEIEKTMDSVASTELVNVKDAPAFDHDCTVNNPWHRRKPAVIDDQGLRDLRHRHAAGTKGAMFAYCPHCTESWTNEELIEDYLKNTAGIPELSSFKNDKQTRRLNAIAIEYQKDRPNAEPPKTVINAAYNHHLSTHVRSCFGDNKKPKDSQLNSSNKRKRDQRQGWSEHECRYRLPQRKKVKTILQEATDEKVSWYSWNGSITYRHIHEVMIKRHAYDTFENVSCPAISLSKLTCNSNISMVFPGPAGLYCFKYTLKNTQQDDTREFGKIIDTIRRSLSRERRHESNRSEAIGRLLSGSFSFQKTNVVGCPMASYLTRNKSRFIFSHPTAWCPLRDIHKILRGQSANTTVQFNGKVPYYQCQALHYLCRPAELEQLSVLKFYAQYEVVRVTSNNEAQLLSFQNNSFQHPSYSSTRGKFLQGIRARSTAHLPKVYQYDFPDTARFAGNILDEHLPIVDVMEEYSLLVLLLMYPFRELADIILQGSFTKKLREAVSSNIIGHREQTYLQNIQDAKANCLRHTKSIKDDLQRVTEVYCPPASLNVDNDDNDDNEEPSLEGTDLMDFLSMLHEEGNPFLNMADDDTQSLPASLELKSILQKGQLKCGYKDVASMDIDLGNTTPIIEVRSGTENRTEMATESDNDNTDPFIDEITRKDIVRVIVTKTSRKTRTFKNITGNDEAMDILQANGTVKSIIDWANKGKLDRGQRRAFEIIVSTFVLTYYEDASTANIDNEDRSVRHNFIDNRKQLELLADERKRGGKQLIGLLHGPGGSGKTTAVDLILEYSREFCEYLKAPFTSRTIIVTAMTGVAATLLSGETTHSAVYLNQKRPIDNDQVELWEQTRLLIIDEISFASKEDFEKLHANIQLLKQCMNKPYGGLHIVFSGDLRQLEPVGKFKRPIYDSDCVEFKDWVNCFMELKGMHRFKHDIEWGKLLFRFRDGEVTLDDINNINTNNVINPNTRIPNNIKYATYFHKDRDSITAALFKKRCRDLYIRTAEVRDSIMIFADNIKVRNAEKQYVPFKAAQTFWQHCGEDDIKIPEGYGRMDPVLKLFRDCEVMLPTNKDVSKGQANGTQACFVKVVLHEGQQHSIVLLDGEIPVKGVLASQISHVVLKHKNDRIHPKEFSVEPTNFTFKARILKPQILRTKENDREAIQMKAQQLPILSNSATTGHKLQGSGVHNLFVHNWSYVTNWVYVMLSRVKTQAGLFSRKKLSTDLSKYAVPDALKRLIEKFRQKRPRWASALSC